MKKYYKGPPPRLATDQTELLDELGQSVHEAVLDEVLDAVVVGRHPVAVLEGDGEPRQEVLQDGLAVSRGEGHEHLRGVDVDEIPSVVAGLLHRDLHDDRVGRGRDEGGHHGDGGGVHRRQGGGGGLVRGGRGHGVGTTSACTGGGGCGGSGGGSGR